MSMIRLCDLPLPPEEKTGWPWTEATDPLPDLTDGRSWPKISLVTPNYNYAHFIEETIRSVLLQGYPNLEYIVLDDGSTDESVEIIKKYEPWLTLWKTGPNKGQTRVINEGFSIATGEILNWLNSDDILCPGAFGKIGEVFHKFPEIDVVVGHSRQINIKKNNLIWDFIPQPLDLIPAMCPFAQPACFYRKKILRSEKALDESYDYVMDLELWAYFKSKNVSWKIIDEELSCEKTGHQNKMCIGGIKIRKELERVYRAYTTEWIPLTFWYRFLKSPLDRFRRRHYKEIIWKHFVWRIYRFVTWLGDFYGHERAQAINWEWFLSRLPRNTLPQKFCRVMGNRRDSLPAGKAGAPARRGGAP